MQVRDAMTTAVLTVTPEHTIGEAAQLMVRRKVGAAVVVDDDAPGFGIITERDVLRVVAEGSDPLTTTVRDAMSYDARCASHSWDLDRAAEEMVRHGFRHLLVMDEAGALVGVMSMRDIVRARLPRELPAAH